MKLFVIGATGRTGQEIVQQALARGHQVTAFVRSPKISPSKVNGSPFSKERGVPIVGIGGNPLPLFE